MFVQHIFYFMLKFLIYSSKWCTVHIPYRITCTLELSREALRSTKIVLLQNALISLYVRLKDSQNWDSCCKITIFLILSTSNVLTAMGLLMFLIKEQPIKPTIFAYYHYALEFRSRPTKHDTFYQWSIDPRTRISRSKLFDLVRTINKKNRKISDQAFPRSLRFTFAEWNWQTNYMFRSWNYSKIDCIDQYSTRDAKKLRRPTN